MGGYYLGERRRIEAQKQEISVLESAEMVLSAGQSYLVKRLVQYARLESEVAGVEGELVIYGKGSFSPQELSEAIGKTLFRVLSPIIA